MSSIAFHFPDEEEVRISGSERAHFSILTEQHAKGAIGLVQGFSTAGLLDDLAPFLSPDGRLNKFKPTGPHCGRNPQFEEALGYVLSTIGFRSGPEPFAWKNRDIRALDLLLNTTLATGSDPVRLAVKIHWQCEIHGYVMGYHRTWLADIVSEGLQEGVFRQGMGWAELVTKLRESAQGPVVTSFSGGEGFPNPYVGSWMPEWPEGVEKVWDALSDEQKAVRHARQEEWYDLSFERRWKTSVKGLKTPGRNKAWGPETLRDRFGHGVSLLDLVHQECVRIEKGLKIT